MRHTSGKNNITILGIVLVVVFSTFLYAESPSSSGREFSIEQYTFNEGTDWMFGSACNINVSSIGDSVINIILSSNVDPPYYALFQGFLYTTRFETPTYDYQYDVDTGMRGPLVQHSPVIDFKQINVD